MPVPDLAYFACETSLLFIKPLEPAAHPRRTKGLPIGLLSALKVCEFENRPVKLHKMAQMDKIQNLGRVRLVDAVANEPQVVVRPGNDERRKFASDDGVHGDR